MPFLVPHARCLKPGAVPVSPALPPALGSRLGLHPRTLGHRALRPPLRQGCEPPKSPAFADQVCILGLLPVRHDHGLSQLSTARSGAPQREKRVLFLSLDPHALQMFGL